MKRREPGTGLEAPGSRRSRIAGLPQAYGKVQGPLRGVNHSVSALQQPPPQSGPRRA